MGKYASELKKVKSFTTFNDHISKKGKIKGKNKKETKILKGMCPHVKISKKGKVKNMIINNRKGACVCQLCGKTFPANFYSDEDYARIIDDFEKSVNQTKFMAVQVNGGTKTIDYTMQLGGMLSQYKKIATRLRDISKKQGKVKDKHKKRDTSRNVYGEWDTH